MARVHFRVAVVLLISINALALPVPSPQPGLLRTLKLELHSRTSLQFENLLKHWQISYGTSAVPGLLTLASDRSLQDTDRYIALMGATKLGGTSIAPQITRYLRDSSWMIRNGALRALSALQDPATARAVLPLLHDPALVVRLEAVRAVQILRPPGAADALISTLADRENYHAGKAQWVPTRALDALVALRASESAPRLRPLLDHSADPDLQLATVTALDTLSKRKQNPVHRAPLAERVRIWKLELLRSGQS